MAKHTVQILRYSQGFLKHVFRHFSTNICINVLNWSVNVVNATYQLQEEQPTPFDIELPAVTPEDIQLLQKVVPELMSELNINDSLDTSTIVRDCLSQSTLTKIVDPHQNKTLEETLNLRKQVLIDNAQLTMSVVKREISRDDIDEFPFNEKISFQVVSANDSLSEDALPEPDFEPESLSSLTGDKSLVTSSDSETMFLSAELDLPKTPECKSPVSCKKLSNFEKSNSSVSMSGKSSSSPIDIQGSSVKRNKKKHGLCQSLSPNYNSPKEEKVSSLPISGGSHLIVKNQELNSSLNSRSLSEALKTVSIEQNITESSTKVKTISKEVKQLHSTLEDLKKSYQNEINTFSTKFLQLKETILENFSKEVNHMTDNEIIENTSDQTDGTISEHSLLMRFSQFKEVLKKEKMNSNILSAFEELCYHIKSSIVKNSLKNENNDDEVCLVNITENNIDKDTQTEAVSVNSESSRTNKQIQTEPDALLTNYEKLKTSFEKLFIEKEKLQNNLDEKDYQYKTIINERNTLNLKLKELQNSTDTLFRQQNESILDFTIKNTVLEKNLSEKEKELSKLQQQKEVQNQKQKELETQNQTNFNLVFNKIKKEKDKQINEITSKCEDLGKKYEELKNENEELKKEINLHKEKNEELLERVKSNETSNTDLLENLSNLRKDRDSLQNRNQELLNDVEELNNTITTTNKEKLNVIQELKTQYEKELEKEKKAILLQLEVEKETQIENMQKSLFGKTESLAGLAKSMSIEYDY